MEAMTYVKELLSKTLHGESDGIYCETISAQNINNENLRDLCMDLGDYVKEDEERPAYVIMIERKMHNPVYMALCCNDGMLYLACKADSGKVNKNSEKKAVDFVRSKISGKSENSDSEDENAEPAETAEQKHKKKSKAKLFIILIALVLIAGGGLFCYYRISNVDKYNKIVSDYNEVAKDYDAMLLLSSVEELDGFPTHVELKEELASGFDAVFTTCDIDALTDEMETLLGHYVALGQITNPSVETIKKQLENVEGIGDILEVTNENDPNAMLGKDEGYTGCLYFSHELVDQDGLTGKDVIEKGTDCGGCIEIFKDKVDAKNRNDYLTGFDDTVLYSGSHKLLGTLIIRISYRLSDETQEILTDAICSAIMNV